MFVYIFNYCFCVSYKICSKYLHQIKIITGYQTEDITLYPSTFHPVLYTLTYQWNYSWSLINFKCFKCNLSNASDHLFLDHVTNIYMNISVWSIFLKVELHSHLTQLLIQTITTIIKRMFFISVFISVTV